MANRDAEIVSPILLKNLKHSATRCISENFNLEMGDWEAWSSLDGDDDFHLGTLARTKCI